MVLRLIIKVAAFLTMPTGRQRRVVVVRVLDGDTLLVKYPGFWSFLRRGFPVRLYGIDAPELAQPYGEESRERLASLVRRGHIDLEEVNRDQYGRRVGLLYRRRRGRQELVNLAMLRFGMAYWYRRYGGVNLGFPEAEAHAAAHRLGVWQGRRRRQRPWDYRYRRRRPRRRRFSRLRWVALLALLAVIWAIAAYLGING